MASRPAELPTAQTAGTRFDSLRYPLGFMAGRLARVPAHYARVPFPLPLSVHPHTRYAVVQTPQHALALIGVAVHPQHPALDLAGVAALLSARFESRQAEIDQLIGRFVVIAGARDGEFALQTDAIGMRATFFATAASGVVAGSHAKLVAGAVGAGPTYTRPVPAALGYPGIATPYAGVQRVPPNVELSFATGRLRRFFPRDALPAVGIEAAWDLAFERAGTAVAALSSRQPLLVSLTGGLDSRTTLAATRGSWARLRFFTYDRGDPSHAIDARVAADIAGALGLDHRQLDFSGAEADPHLLDVVKDNSFGNHGRRLACAYHERFGGWNDLHVRTNLLELARSNLFAANDRLAALHGGPTDAERMAAFYFRAGRMEPGEHARPAFERYIEATDFASTRGRAGAWDLYFVEHRMGAWHAGIVLESDIAFDTVIAFNSREVVRHFMGVPQEVRSSSSHLLQRLQAALPELDGVPINPRRYPLPQTEDPRVAANA